MIDIFSNLLKYVFYFNNDVSLVIFVFFAIISILSLINVLIALKNNGKLFLKIVTLLTFIMLMPTIIFSYSNLVGRPKPLNFINQLQFHQNKELIVLSFHLVEDRVIYILLKVDNQEEPSYISLPWSKKLAEQLYGSQKIAEARGTKVMMRQRFQNSLDDRDPIFYPAPQPVPPDKEKQDSNIIYMPPLYEDHP